MASTFPEIVSRPPGPERYAWARDVVFASRTARASLPDMVAIARDWEADLIVREAAEYGGCLAAELLDIPHAVVRTDSGSSSYADRHHVANSLDAIRADVGLSPDPDAAMAFRYLLLSFAPRCLDPPDDEAAPTAHLLRPSEPPDTGGAVDIAQLTTHPEQPTVYATLGTIYNQPDVLTGIVQALATEPVNLIMTVGPDLDPTAFDPHLPNVKIARWIPQHLLLPHCAAVVTHGGYGTVTAALTHGCPLVLLPISADQPHNAAGCAAAGVGINVAPSERSPETIREATAEVLGQSGFRQAAPPLGCFSACAAVLERTSTLCRCGRFSVTRSTSPSTSQRTGGAGSGGAGLVDRTDNQDANSGPACSMEYVADSATTRRRPNDRLAPAATAPGQQPHAASTRPSARSRRRPPDRMRPHRVTFPRARPAATPTPTRTHGSDRSAAADAIGTSGALARSTTTNGESSVPSPSWSSVAR